MADHLEMSYAEFLARRAQLTSAGGFEPEGLM